MASIEAHIDDKNYARTCLYLLACSSYLPQPDDATVLRTAYNCYMKVRGVAVGWGVGGSEGERSGEVGELGSAASVVQQRERGVGGG